MLLFQLNEATAARRRIPVVLVDDTDGKTAETGITLSAGDLKLSKNGAAEANHAGTLVELAGGDYEYEATAGELDTLGYLRGRLIKAGCRTFRFVVQVVAFDPYERESDWDGTLAAIAATATTLPSGHGLDPNAVVLIKLTGGTDAKPRMRLHTYSGAGDVWTPTPAWNVGGQPVPSGTVTAIALAVAPTAPEDLAAIADAVHDEVMSGHVTAGTFGAAVASLLAYVDELETRLSATRAGYLDKLNIAGNVASSGEVTAIQNNTRVNRSLPAVLERPDSGSLAFRIELACYDDAGNMEAPDSAPTLDVVNQAGTSRNANLDSTTMALVSTGRYRATYTVDVAHAMEQLLFAFSVIEGGATRVYLNSILVVDTTAVDFTSADRTQLQAIHTKLPSKSYLAGTNNPDGDVQLNEATGTPADSAGTTTLVGLVTPTRAGNLDNLDAAVSSRAAPGAAMALTSGERSSIVAALFAAVSEGSETFIQTFRLMRAGIVGKSSGHAAGTPAYRDAADTKNRITAVTTVDGDRTSVTTDGT